MGKKSASSQAKRAEQTGELVAPPALTVAFALGFEATRGTHPDITEPLLDLTFVAVGHRFIIRIPVTAWPAIENGVHQALGTSNGDAEAAQRAAKAGIHLPDGVDVAGEADAHAKLRGDDGR